MKLVPPSDPILRSRCDAVTDIPKQLTPHLAGMRRILLRTKGLALAAPQVGVGLRFFLRRGPPMEWFINPTYVPEQMPKVPSAEGCLSFPGLVNKIVMRWPMIHAQWINLYGGVCSDTFSEQNAFTFQHECDHLDGVCIYPST